MSTSQIVPAFLAILMSVPGAVTSQAPATPAVPKIPLCPGLTLVTAVNTGGVDYESIKTVESVDDKQYKLRYATEKVDYGDMFSSAPPKLRAFETRRTVLHEDARTSRSYLQEFSPEIPEFVPGMTAVGTSTLVLSELKAKGEAEFGLSHWAFAVPPNLNKEDSQSIYHKQMPTRSKVVERVKLPVLVNGQPVEFPAIHTHGNFYSYISDFWFLDQADNPLTLKFRIGIGELKPLSEDTKENCKAWAKAGPYPPQHCLMPDGGDLKTLDLVKINFRCAAAVPPPGGGSGSGAGAGTGAIGVGRAGGTGGGAGSGTMDLAGAAQLESALEKESRVEIFDIFFATDSDEIRKESEPRLRDIAEVLKRHPDWKLKVEGHTDSLSADDYNLKLSQRRAAAVKNALVSRHGIQAARLTPEGFGETRPRSPNDTMTGRARNRRVELVRLPSPSTHSSR